MIKTSETTYGPFLCKKVAVRWKLDKVALVARKVCYRRKGKALIQLDGNRESPLQREDGSRNLFVWVDAAYTKRGI